METVVILLSKAVATARTRVSHFIATFLAHRVLVGYSVETVLALAHRRELGHQNNCENCRKFQEIGQKIEKILIISTNAL